MLRERLFLTLGHTLSRPNQLHVVLTLKQPLDDTRNTHGHPIDLGGPGLGDHRDAQGTPCRQRTSLLCR